MSILVIAEHDNNNLNSATLNTVTAALQIGSDLDLLVAGYDCSSVATAASQVVGVNRVLVADSDTLNGQLAENMANLLVSLATEYNHILVSATTFGKNLLPRAAAMLDVSQISDISAVVSADTFIRPIYAGNAMATVQSSDSKKQITVRVTKFNAAAASGGNATINPISVSEDSGLSRYIGLAASESERVELASADIVVSGGRGMQNGDNFAMLEAVADKLRKGPPPVPPPPRPMSTNIGTLGSTGNTSSTLVRKHLRALLLLPLAHTIHSPYPPPELYPNTLSYQDRPTPEGSLINLNDEDDDPIYEEQEDNIYSGLDEDADTVSNTVSEASFQSTQQRPAIHSETLSSSYLIPIRTVSEPEEEIYDNLVDRNENSLIRF